MPKVASLEALYRAAADFAVTDLNLVMEPSALAAGRQSLDESGFLLGYSQCARTVWRPCAS